MVFGAAQPEGTRHRYRSNVGRRMKSFSKVTVGVDDLDQALDLWVDTFGLELVARERGPDAELGRLWGIDAADIERQALVGTPGQRLGRLHFVEFNNPDPPVRRGAATFDACPKNLDIYVDDMTLQVEKLKRRGYEFRNDHFSEVTAPNGMRVREIHLPAHDDLNIVLLQVIDNTLAFPPGGFAGVGPLVTIAPNVCDEGDFYRQVLGLDLVMESVLKGTHVEKMIGLPEGTALHFSVWGDSDAPFGRLEVVSYEGVTGSNLFGRARPKALGILHVSYTTDNLVTLTARLEDADVAYRRHGLTTTIGGSGETISFSTPAGFRVEAVQLD